MSRFVYVGLIFATLLQALPADAQTGCGARADELEAEGMRLYQEDHPAQALERFQQSRAQCGGVRALGRIGLAESALDRFVEAEQHIQQALTEGRSDPWVVENRARLEEDLAYVSARLGTIELLGGGPSSEVTLNGEARGRWPAQRRFRVLAGAVALVVRAPGCREWTRTATVAAGSAASETVALSCRTTSSGSARRTLAWVSAGAAAVALSVGAVGLGFYLDRLTAWNDDNVCFLPNGRTREQNCTDAWSTIQIAGPVAWVGFGMAAAFAVTSVTLFATMPAEPRAGGTTAALRCGLGPGELGIACGGAF